MVAKACCGKLKCVRSLRGAWWRGVGSTVTTLLSRGEGGSMRTRAVVHQVPNTVESERTTESAKEHTGAVLPRFGVCVLPSTAYLLAATSTRNPPRRQCPYTVAGASSTSAPLACIALWSRPWSKHSHHRCSQPSCSRRECVTAVVRWFDNEGCRCRLSRSTHVEERGWAVADAGGGRTILDVLTV